METLEQRAIRTGMNETLIPAAALDKLVELIWWERWQLFWSQVAFCALIEWAEGGSYPMFRTFKPNVRKLIYDSLRKEVIP